MACNGVQASDGGKGYHGLSNCDGAYTNVEPLPRSYAQGKLLPLVVVRRQDVTPAPHLPIIPGVFFSLYGCLVKEVGWCCDVDAYILEQSYVFQYRLYMES
jgi:hypothetical protein